MRLRPNVALCSLPSFACQYQTSEVEAKISAQLADFLTPRILSKLSHASLVPLIPLCAQTSHRTCHKPNFLSFVPLLQLSPVGGLFYWKKNLSGMGYAGLQAIVLLRHFPNSLSRPTSSNNLELPLRVHAAKYPRLLHKPTQRSL